MKTTTVQCKCNHLCSTQCTCMCHVLERERQLEQSSGDFRDDREKDDRFRTRRD